MGEDGRERSEVEGDLAAGRYEQVKIEGSGEVVVERLEVAVTPVSRFLGLMGRAGLKPGHGLWLQPCNSIHMFFMRFPIDVVWLSSQKVVLKISSNVRPWIGMGFCWGAGIALELPAGGARLVKPGDRLVRV